MSGDYKPGAELKQSRKTLLGMIAALVVLVAWIAQSCNDLSSVPLPAEPKVYPEESAQ